MEEKRKQIDIPFNTAVPTVVETTSTFFKNSSYCRGYHAYKNVWNPLGDDHSFICDREKKMYMTRMQWQLNLMTVFQRKSLCTCRLTGVNLPPCFSRFPAVVCGGQLQGRE